MRHRYSNLTAVLCIGLIGLLASPTKADSENDRALAFGIRGGLALMNVTETPASWEDYKTWSAGVVVGALAIKPVSNHWAVQPELVYIQKGFGARLLDGIIPVDLTLSIDYIELPVLLRYSLAKIGPATPYLFAGPALGFVLSSDLEASASILSASVDISSLTQVSDFGAVVGAGAAFPAGSGQIVVDARFQRGFTNVLLTGDFTINGSTQTIDEDDFKTYGFVFSLGYVF